MIDKPNVLIRVHKDGTILYSVRISLVLSCPMHLQFYPMDVQQCFIDLASYAYTTKDIGNLASIYYYCNIMLLETRHEPVQLKQGLSSSLPSFKLNNVSTTYCTSITNTGTYSCLRTVLELRRQFSYYLLQLYIPSCMLVIVSWVSFWIDRTAVPARVTLGVTTLLTMTTQSSGINAKLPPVAYIKAIDVWIGACLTFIFGALLEFAWVTYIANRTQGRRKETKSKMLLVRENDEVWVPRIIRDQEFEKAKVLNNRMNPQRPFHRWLARTIDWHDEAKRADLVSRLLFPLLFVSFNVAYWIHYAQYQTPT
ncbi:Cation transporter family protein [Cooperia oncophora]